MQQQIEEHQFKAFLSAMPSTHAFAGLILLACRKKDGKLLGGCWVYFSREFGTDYLVETYTEEVEPLLTSKESQWFWRTIRKQD
jgi:hypothetical protein